MIYTTMSKGGTLNLHGGQPVTVAVPINGAPPITVDVSGAQRLAFNPVGWGEDITVNLADHSMWIGTFSGSPGTVYHINGPQGLFINNGDSRLLGTAIIEPNVIGNGSITQDSAHTQGKLEFMHYVGGGETIHVEGYALYGGQHGVLQIDQPSAFHAQVDLGFGHVILEGMHATSYSMKNDMLLLFNGNHVVDALRFALDTTPPGSNGPVGFGVAQVGSSVVIHADGEQYAGWRADDRGIALGLHG